MCSRAKISDMEQYTSRDPQPDLFNNDYFLDNVLLAHGSAVSMPYWDWTELITELPALFHDATYYNSRTHSKELNPFFR